MFHLLLVNVTMLKNLNSRCFDFCFVAVLIIPEFHNLSQLYWININPPQIHWSIILVLFIRIPLQFVTFQWKQIYHPSNIRLCRACAYKKMISERFYEYRFWNTPRGLKKNDTHRYLRCVTEFWRASTYKMWATI